MTRTRHSARKVTGLRWEAPGRLRITGGDRVGAMYGGLDVAEAIRLGTLEGLPDDERRPYIARRGIKFNIPLDLRTPGYSDNSDAFQANIPEMWSEAFWREFLDEMARHRFNVLSLWNLHPFPSIVKVPEYPEVALDDVLRGRREWFDETFPFDGRNMFKPEFLRDAEIVKRLTIDEKIGFWQRVMQMAMDRGIDVYWFTWNVFLNGAARIRALESAMAQSKELRLTVGDIESFARLGHYYAAKIEAACALALYDATSEPEHQREALRHLDRALDHWKRYASSYTRQYRQPLLYNRVGWVDLTKLTGNVAADLDIARQWSPGSVAPPPTRDSKLRLYGD